MGMWMGVEEGGSRCLHGCRVFMVSVMVSVCGVYPLSVYPSVCYLYPSHCRLYPSHCHLYPINHTPLLHSSFVSNKELNPLFDKSHPSPCDCE